MVGGIFSFYSDARGRMILDITTETGGYLPLIWFRELLSPQRIMLFFSELLLTVQEMDRVRIIVFVDLKKLMGCLLYP